MMGVIAVASLVLNPLRMLGCPIQEQASVYVGVVSWGAFVATAIAATQTVLPYGSSKNRTDTAAALLTFGILIIIGGVATLVYIDDRNLVYMCEGLPAGALVPVGNFACDAVSLLNARTNAEELQRITTLTTLGQVVPLLSISKDILQSWFSPPGVDETATIRAVERKRARQERRLAAERTKLSWAPVWAAWAVFAVLLGLLLLSRLT